MKWGFPYNAYFCAFLASALVSALSLPLWRRWCRKIGLVDHPGHRKIHHRPIPLAGGLAVATGLVIPIILAMATVHLDIFSALDRDLLTYGIEKRAIQLGAILVGACGMLLLGIADDRSAMRPGPKFLIQVAIVALVAASGVRITLFVENTAFSYVATILWMLTVIISFNIIDNMNGLCCGLAAIAAAAIALHAAIPGQYLVALLAFAVSGTLLGFLPFNYPNASAFLGDSGSHLVGYLMAVLAILPHFYHEENLNALAVLNPLLIFAVPLGDLACVVWIRKRLGRPIYEGDNNHLSHRLTRRGMSKAQTVAVIWGLALLFASVSFAL